MMDTLIVDYLQFENFEEDEEELESEYETKTCPACFGTGEDRFEYADCLECWGEGIV